MLLYVKYLKLSNAEEAPIIEAGGLDAPLVDNQFIGSPFYRSPFKGPPTPQVEEAWQSTMQCKLTYDYNCCYIPKRNNALPVGMISVSAEDILRSGYNLSAAKFPPEAGGGYMGVATTTHQLHYLHYVWADHHISYFPSVQAVKNTTPKMHELHYEHCIDYVRQSLMCN